MDNQAVGRRVWENTSSRQAQQVRLSLNFLPAVTIQVIFLQIQLFIVNKKIFRRS